MVTELPATSERRGKDDSTQAVPLKSGVAPLAIKAEKSKPETRDAVTARMTKFIVVVSLRAGFPRSVLAKRTLGASFQSIASVFLASDSSATSAGTPGSGFSRGATQTSSARGRSPREVPIVGALLQGDRFPAFIAPLPMAA